MPIYKIFPNADATLYSLFPSKNTGLDEILEVSVKSNYAESSLDDIRRSVISFKKEDLEKNHQANLAMIQAASQGARINMERQMNLEVYQIQEKSLQDQIDNKDADIRALASGKAQIVNLQ